jgi:integrase
LRAFLNAKGVGPTASTYRSVMKQFFEVALGEEAILYADEFAMCDEYFSRQRNYVDDLMKFATYYRRRMETQRLTRGTAKTSLAIVLAFFTFIGVEISRLDRRRIRMYLPKSTGSTAVAEEQIPTHRQLHLILDALPIEGKAFFTVLKSTGMRPKEAVNLTLSNIDWSTYEVPCVRLLKTKEGRPRIAFLDREATHYLKKWIDEYRNNVAEPQDTRIFPFGRTPYRFFEALWESALRKTGLDKTDMSTSHEKYVYRMYTLRKYFRQRGIGSRKYGIQGIDPDILEALMGHQAYLTKVYASYSPEQLAGEFNAGQKALWCDFAFDELVKEWKEQHNMDISQI